MTHSALITGAAGQDGRYLAELLLGRGYQVYGMVGPDPGEYASWVAARGPMMTPVEGDLTDRNSIDELMRSCAPREVYNFAGMSSVGASWHAPELYMEINGRGVVRLLESMEAFAPAAHMVQASSAEIFGDPQHSPQNEDTPVAPTNPYGESKLMGHVAVQQARARGLHASNAIFYNHESPMRPVTFVTGKIADAAARIKLGLASDVHLGNLDVVRDWGFAGDYVEAMARIACAERPGDFVVATGEGHTVRQFAQVAFAYVGLDYERYVVVDPDFFREADATALVGDSARIRTQLGWTPAMGFDRLVEMMVDAAMERLS
ncbi:MAG: GDP-mannose 4,6-dehydratase [Coriobacteriia bacterium]|nr:GDP-mannose 4,6-dehydratase [Coriobacteriia bacterium]